MKKSAFAWLVVLTMVAGALLTGCQGTAPSAAPSSAAATTAPATTAPATTAPEKTATPTPEPTATPAPTVNNPGSVRTDTLVVAGNVPEGKFLPVYSSTVQDSEIGGLVFEGLLINDPTGAPIPWLAEKWDISADGLTYTFHLKKGIKYSNGDELKASDVVFTYKIMADKSYLGARQSAVSSLVGFKDFNTGKSTDFPGVTATDDYTVVFKLAQAKASAIWDFGYGIMSEKYYGPYTQGNLDNITAKLVDAMGTGPYLLKNYTPGESCKFEANANYWGGAPKVAKIVYRFIDDTAVLLQEIEAGNVDVASIGPDADTVAMVDKTGIYNKYLYEGLDYTHIGFNTRSAPLNDKRVRAALAYGLDREAFLQARYGDYGFTLDVPFAKASWAYDNTLPPITYDTAKAEALLDEAGWKKGADGFRVNDKGEALSIKFSCWQGSKFADLIVAAVKDNWEKIGVKVDIEQMEFATLTTKIFDKQDFQCYVMGWSLSIDPDPTDLYGKAATAKGGFNPGGWSSDVSETLLASGLAVTDQGARKAIYSQWSKLFLDEMPYIMIGSSEQFNVVNVRVKGLEFSTYRGWQYEINKVELAQ